MPDPPDRPYSRVNSGRRELIDHILVSHRLIHRVTQAGTGLPGGGTPRLPSVGTDPAERRGAAGSAGSDHAPVWVRVGQVRAPMGTGQLGGLHGEGQFGQP